MKTSNKGTFYYELPPAGTVRKVILLFVLISFVIYSWSYADLTSVWLGTHHADFLRSIDEKKSSKFSKNTARNSSNQLHHQPEVEFEDRIIKQLSFVPPTLDEITQNGTKFKTIFLLNTSQLWIPTALGQRTFLEEGCLVNTCTITTNQSDLHNADAIVFSDRVNLPAGPRPLKQIWLLFILESPFATPSYKAFSKVFNWTATYRMDSDIPIQYDKFFRRSNNVSVIRNPIERNFAANKTRKVAWFVSDCKSANKRLLSALQLSQFIEVDIYGPCLGKKTCSKSNSKACFQMLKNDYKFYLAFENANCQDYITEKFFVNSLRNDVIPVVLGARKQEYTQMAPLHSFIYAQDFPSPQALADYLMMLDANDALYNEYFQWKGTGEFSKKDNFQNFWCRFCTMLHSNVPTKTYDDIDAWWRGPNVCAKDQQRLYEYVASVKDSLQWQWTVW